MTRTRQLFGEEILIKALNHWGATPADSKHTRNFWEKLWAGYRMENDLDSSWLEQRHWFFKLREIILYVVISKDPSVQDDEWCKWYMTGRREPIIDGRPVVEL